MDILGEPLALEPTGAGRHGLGPRYKVVPRGCRMNRVSCLLGSATEG